MKQIVNFTDSINQTNIEFYLGNKGANLFKLYKELNIPDGFIVTSIVYFKYKELQLNQFKDYLKSQLNLYISKIFQKSKKVSVRASYQYIMPGMMPTVLNISSINDVIDIIIQIYQSSNYQAVLKYKQINNIQQNCGLAIIIQQMVYGNYNQNSYTGVFTTRNILSGQNKISGQFLHKATGNQLLSGFKTPKNLQCLPQSLYLELLDIANKIEHFYCYVQQIEFTIENNKIYILQCRQPNLTPFAKIKILYDLYSANLINKTDIIKKLSYMDYEIVQNSKIIDFASSDIEYICNGISISYTISSGKLKFQNSNLQQNNNILYVTNAIPAYIKYIKDINGIISNNGGYTSHLCSILRQTNKAGLIQPNIFKQSNFIFINGKKIFQNQNIVIDGYNGILYKGKAKLIENLQYKKYINLLQQFF